MTRQVQFFGTISDEKLATVIPRLQGLADRNGRLTLDEQMIGTLATVLIRERAESGKTVSSEEMKTFGRAEYEAAVAKAVEEVTAEEAADFTTDAEGVTSPAWGPSSRLDPVCPDCGERHPSLEQLFSDVLGIKIEKVEFLDLAAAEGNTSDVTDDDVIEEDEASEASGSDVLTLNEKAHGHED